MRQLGSSSSVGDLLSWVAFKTCIVLTELERCWVSGQCRRALVFPGKKKKHNVFIYCQASPSAFSCTCLWLKWWLEGRCGFFYKTRSYSNGFTRSGVSRGPSGSDGNLFSQALEGTADMRERMWNSPLCVSPFTVSHFKQCAAPCRKANG